MGGEVLYEYIDCVQYSEARHRSIFENASLRRRIKCDAVWLLKASRRAWQRAAVFKTLRRSLACGTAGKCFWLCVECSMEMFVADEVSCRLLCWVRRRKIKYYEWSTETPDVEAYR